MQINMVWAKCFVHLLSNAETILAAKYSNGDVDEKDRNIWSFCQGSHEASGKTDQQVIQCAMLSVTPPPSIQTKSMGVQRRAASPGIGWGSHPGCGGDIFDIFDRPLNIDKSPSGREEGWMLLAKRIRSTPSAWRVNSDKAITIVESNSDRRIVWDLIVKSFKGHARNYWFYFKGIGEPWRIGDTIRFVPECSLRWHCGVWIEDGWKEEEVLRLFW